MARRQQSEKLKNIMGKTNTFTIREIPLRSVWEDFLLRFSPHALFQSWLWGEVQKRSGIKIWRFGLYENDLLSAIFQVTKILARRGIHLHVRHGPVCSKLNETQIKSIVEFLKTLARNEGAWFIRISPLTSGTEETQALFKTQGGVPSAIHAMDGELCWVLDLSGSEEELLSQMRKTTRYEIRQKEKFNVVVIQSQEQRYFEEFLTLYRDTSLRQGFVPHVGIAEEFALFAKEQRADLFLGYHDKKLVSGALILYYNDQAIYHHGASIVSKVPVSTIVQWEAIKEAKKRGIKVYNFWGIAPLDNPKHPWRGLTLFKKGFGGREINTIHSQDFPVLPFYYITRIIEIVRKLNKGY